MALMLWVENCELLQAAVGTMVMTNMLYNGSPAIAQQATAKVHPSTVQPLAKDHQG
jgi:hypothetical protein